MFLQKEKEICAALTCEVDVPTMIDFTSLFCKILKFKIVFDYEEKGTLSTDLCKIFLSDDSM